MFQIGFPVHRKDVTKVVRPEHLAPWFPRVSWDGYFAIAIFPGGPGIKWLKAHLFRAACGPGDTPLAAVEGFGPVSNMLIAWATSDDVVVLERNVDASGLKGRPNPLRVEIDDLFLLEGRAPEYEECFTLPGMEASVNFAFEAGWPIWWSRWGRILTYSGQHSSVRVDLTRGTETYRLNGLGVMEHVCGISLPFDFTRLIPFHYHWDVLHFSDTNSPADSAAGLSIGWRGETLVRLRSAARLPGHRPESMGGLVVRYLETRRERTGKGEEIMVPVRWEGLLRGKPGVFSYSASATTPVAQIIPGGGMLGFDFEGRLESPGGGLEEWNGTGFTEYGDFSGKLAGIAGPR